MSQLARFVVAGGPGSGTVTSISEGPGITLTPNPITTTGTVSLTIPVIIAYGGTNATSFSTIDGTVYYNGTSLVTTATGTSGQVLTSNGAGVAPSYQSIGGGFANSFPTDAGTATPAAGILNVFGGTAGRDINTTGAGNTVHVELNNAITLGDLAVLGSGVNALSATTGDINIAAGNLKLPNTNTTGTVGEIQFGGSRFISNWNSSAFFGAGSGNTTNTSLSPNFGFGTSALSSLTTGLSNSAFGPQALSAVTSGSYNHVFGNGFANVNTGSYNCGFGINTGGQVSTGSYNCALGDHAGTSWSIGTESSNICILNDGVINESNTTRIGSSGVGNRQQSRCFIGGIDGVNVGSVAKVLTMASDQVGTATLTAGAGVTITPTANTITISVTSGATVVETITGNTGGAISPTAGNINIVTNNSNIVFAGAASTETLDFALTSNLLLGSGGSIAGGVDNVALGKLAGASISSGTDNTCIGYEAMVSGSTGSFNTALGAFSMFTAGAGATNNTAVGYSSLYLLGTGDYNCCLGDSAGSALTLTDSSNIMLMAAGTAGDNNTIRIGRPGSGAGQQNKCYICGIDGVNVGSVAKVVTMASDQLGTATITAGTNITVTPGANTITIAASGGASLTWSTITANQTAAVNNGYFCNKAGTLALALPAASAVGDIIEVANINTATGVQFTQAANQQIFIANTSTTLGATGTLTSISVGDTLKIVCRTANLVWQVTSIVGNWTPA